MVIGLSTPRLMEHVTRVTVECLKLALLLPSWAIDDKSIETDNSPNCSDPERSEVCTGLLLMPHPARMKVNRKIKRSS